MAQAEMYSVLIAAVSFSLSFETEIARNISAL
jgi:hypothetical protein